MKKIINFLKNIFYKEKISPEQEKEILNKIIKRIKES